VKSHIFVTVFYHYVQNQKNQPVHTFFVLADFLYTRFEEVGHIMVWCCPSVCKLFL